MSPPGSARGEDEATDVGVLRMDAHVDDSKDGVGVGGAGDHEDAHASPLGIEQDGDGVVAERSGEREHGERVGAGFDRVDEPAWDAVGGAGARHEVPFG